MPGLDLPPLTVSAEALGPHKRSILAEVEQKCWNAYWRKESIELGKALGVPEEYANLADGRPNLVARAFAEELYRALDGW